MQNPNALGFNKYRCHPCGVTFLLSTVFNPEHCPSCGEALTWHGAMPVISLKEALGDGWRLNLWKREKWITLGKSEEGKEGSEMCPQCDSANLFGPNENGEMVCLDCNFVFDQDEIGWGSSDSRWPILGKE